MMKIEFNDFLKHIKSKNFFGIKKRILVAVSGGVDSMVLLHLMQQTDYQLSVAHIDHHTRDGQSTIDATFVEKYCNNYDLQFHKSDFKDDNPENGNFHNKAHEYRYKYFDSLGYDYILTAHHKDDNAETITLNFINGKSIKGIPEVNGNIIRPLLLYTKSAIETYADNYDVPYVEDTSNSTDTYDRNFIRNEVIPLINSHFDNVEDKLINHSIRRRNDDKLLQRLIAEKIQLDKTDNNIFISKDIINNDVQLLFHSIKKFGFNRYQAVDMISAIEHTGSMFHTKDYTLLVDRNYLIISEKYTELTDIQYIDIEDLPKSIKYLDNILSFEMVNAVEEEVYNICYYPTRLLDNTLLIRTWRHGDSFCPIGMNGQRKTLKKFFADSKVDRLTKHQIPLLLSGGDIMWICGYRSDDRFRYDESDTEFLKVTLLS
jgi:tRNA(Ile)-lysidine synthase